MGTSYISPSIDGQHAGPSKFQCFGCSDFGEGEGVRVNPNIVRIVRAGLNDGLFSETMDFRDFPSVLSAVLIAQS